MPTSAQDVAHLLRRVGFGALPAEINALTSLDRSALVDQILNVTPTAAPTPTAVTSGKEKWEAASDLINWWLMQMATTRTPIIEKMALFWHGHFTSSIEKAELMPMWEQNQLFRTNGLGNFETLLQSVSVGVAMLDYLDNRTNTKDQLNENFGRELMELFCLGAGNYNQSDVVDVARAWTGHGTDEKRLKYAYDPANHDSGTKTILGATAPWTGPQVLSAFCAANMAPVVAKHLTKKLWTFFAYADPDEALINRLSETFVKSKLNIKTLLRAIFVSDEFFSAKSRQGHVRSPVEFVVATARYTGVSTEVMNAQWQLGNMGQRLFYPPNVAGWPGDKAWITNSATWAKGNYARTVVWTKENEAFLANTKDLSVAAAVNKTLSTFGIDFVSNATHQAITQALTNERAAGGWAERQMLIVMTMLSPEYQAA